MEANAPKLDENNITDENSVIDESPVEGVGAIADKSLSGGGSPVDDEGPAGAVSPAYDGDAAASATDGAQVADESPVASEAPAADESPAAAESMAAAGKPGAVGTDDPDAASEAAKRRALRKTRVGKVISDKMDKTVVVAIETSVRHKLYKKIIKRTYKLKAHDENNDCGIGDKVKVMETRPLSRDKRWRLVEILEKAK